MTIPAGVETPEAAGRTAELAGTLTPATAMPEAIAAPAAAAANTGAEPESLAGEVAGRRLGERLRRIAPFFADSRRGFVLAFVGACSEESSGGPVTPTFPPAEGFDGGSAVDGSVAVDPLADGSTPLVDGSGGDSGDGADHLVR